MTYYFIGGEDHDFTKIGACTVDTSTTAARRTANARCALKVGASSAVTDGWSGTLSAAASQFWLSTQLYFSNTGASNTSAEMIVLLDGTTRRLKLQPSANVSGAVTWVLNKVTSSGTSTALATASAAIATSTLIKVDIYVNYATSGQVQVYIGGTKIIDYSGDVTTDSATTLSGFVLGQAASSNSLVSANWSEVIVGTDDTRSLNLITLAPTANGNTFAWSNSYANLNEVTTDDTGICTSGTAGDLGQVTISSSGITGTPAIRAVCVSARAQKGGTGPQNLQLNVRTGGSDYFSGTQSLPTAFGRVAAIFEQNPATSSAFAYTDLTAAGFNIGAKSIT